MKGTIMKGSELSCWETQGIVIGISKNENRNGEKSKFAVFTVQDIEGGDPTKVFKFEENIFPGAISILGKYKLTDDKGETVTDIKGGVVINLKALKNSEDADAFKRFITWPGGLIERYKLAKGPCYANDVNGNQVLDKNRTPVVKTEIKVFTQVKFYIVNDQGGMVPNYLNGMGLQEQGERLEKQFYRKPVTPVTQATEGAAGGETPNTDPF